MSTKIAKPVSLPTQLKRAEAREKKDAASLASVEKQQKQLDSDLATLEKLVPADKSVFESAKQTIDTTFKKTEDALAAKLTADKKEVAKLKKEIAAQQTTPGLNKKQVFKGGDFSHWQSNTTFQSAIKGMQWAAIKATQGTGYVDPSFKSWWHEMGTRIQQGQQKLRIAYHFLNPGNGAAQAKFFLDTLGIHGRMPPGTRVALDWEGAALSSPGTLRDAANYIHHVTGQWPLVYTSDSRVSTAKKYVPNAPIWDAHWGSGINGYQFQQISDGPGYDHDVFVGSLADLERFAGMPVK